MRAAFERADPQDFGSESVLENPIHRPANDRDAYNFIASRDGDDADTAAHRIGMAVVAIDESIGLAQRRRH